MKERGNLLLKTEAVSNCNGRQVGGTRTVTRNKVVVTNHGHRKKNLYTELKIEIHKVVEIKSSGMCGTNTHIASGEVGIIILSGNNLRVSDQVEQLINLLLSIKLSNSFWRVQQKIIL